MYLIKAKKCTKYSRAWWTRTAKSYYLVIIDHWVIENALLTLSQSLEHENAVLIIKLSDDSLQSKQLLPFITKCICNANLKGDHRIIFELNEKAIITAHKEVTEIVKGLHKINCGLAIDHFGTTNDSHKLASELAVDFIKIHNPAINQILQDASARAAMHSLIQSAVQSDRKVIVGALEDPKIMSLLCEWGVSHFLGYFIQEPYQALSSPVLDTVVTINL